jgi:hypothetical protein
VTALGLCAAYLLTDGVACSVVFLAATLIPGVAVLLVLAFRRPPRPQPWWCAAAGLLLLTVDSVTWLVRVGVVLRPGTSTTPEKVLSAADTRMYETKRGRAPGVQPGLAPSAGSAGPA